HRRVRPLLRDRRGGRGDRRPADPGDGEDPGGGGRARAVAHPDARPAAALGAARPGRGGAAGGEDDRARRGGGGPKRRGPPRRPPRRRAPADRAAWSRLGGVPPYATCDGPVSSANPPP